MIVRDAMDQTEFEDEVRDMVTMKTLDEEEFTAHDITTMLRATHPTSEIAHSDVRAEIKKLYRGGEMGDYTTELADGIPGQPILYVPVNPNDA